MNISVQSLCRARSGRPAPNSEHSYRRDIDIHVKGRAYTYATTSLRTYGTRIRIRSIRGPVPRTERYARSTQVKRCQFRYSQLCIKLKLYSPSSRSGSTLVFAVPARSPTATAHSLVGCVGSEHGSERRVRASSSLIEFKALCAVSGVLSPHHNKS
jgi:hypothetical protein